MKEDKVLALLSNLGTTADQVAMSLMEKGVRGSVMLASSCPIAQYLKNQKVGKDIGVGPETAYYYTRHGFYGFLWFVSQIEHAVSLPIPVRDFIQAFDEGKYPELKAK